MMELRGVSKSFGPLRLFDELDFHVPEGKVTCLLGPSGCGKTTMLNMLAGITAPDSGHVSAPERISFVFQESRLLPWATIAENASYAMDSGMAAAERRERLEEMMELMELGDAAEKKPAEVSGGMARRCALARALLAPFDGILLDEPLSSLDPELRNRILDRLPALIKGKPVLLVTHDYGVASVLSDRIYRLSEPPVTVGDVSARDLKSVISQLDFAD